MFTCGPMKGRWIGEWVGYEWDVWEGGRSGVLRSVLPSSSAENRFKIIRSHVQLFGISSGARFFASQAAQVQGAGMTSLAEVARVYPLPSSLAAAIAQHMLPVAPPAEHLQSVCKPCVFYPKGRCHSPCRFCHYIHKKCQRDNLGKRYRKVCRRFLAGWEPQEDSDGDHALEPGVVSI